jgi:O-antigen ligase
LGEALPLIADTPSHLLFGRGFDAFQATAGVHDSEMAATPTIWTVNGGPNDDYMRAVLEQGLLGLVALVAWVGGAILLGVRTSLRLPKRSDRRLIVAGLTAGTLCYAVALAGHDLTHNRLDLSFIALFAGILVSVCTNYQHISADDQEVAIADSEDQ